MKTQREAATALSFLAATYMGYRQCNAIVEGMKGEEKQFFFDKVCELADQIKAMPETYGQDGMGENAIVHLHYFMGSADWWITEKDAVEDQNQAFGLADLGMGCQELGYISIPELLSVGAELDLYWTPKTLAEVRAKAAA